MGRKKNLKGVDLETMNYIDEKMSSEYRGTSTDYVSRNKGLDYKLNLKLKNEKQKQLNEIIKLKEITFCSGSAGTGKSYVAMATLLDLLKQDNAYKKITLIVPTVQSDLELGFLKGTLEDKIGPHAEAHLYTLEKIIDNSGGDGKIAVQALKKYDLIEIRPISFLRGFSLDNRLILCEESQNIPISGFKTILTRIGENSKLIFLGDIDQVDNKELKKKGNRSGLEYAIEKLSKIEEIGTVKFENEDIVRNKLISIILDNWN